MSRRACYRRRGARAAREKKRKSMEQCFRGDAGKRRVLARTLFHDCSIKLARVGSGGFTTESRRHWAGILWEKVFSIKREK